MKIGIFSKSEFVLCFWAVACLLSSAAVAGSGSGVSADYSCSNAGAQCETYGTRAGGSSNSQAYDLPTLTTMFPQTSTNWSSVDPTLTQVQSGTMSSMPS